MKKPIIVFLICFIVIGFITLYFPIKMYNGEAVYFSGMIEEQDLSLSFLINKTEFLKNYPNVKDIYLNKIGWALVVAINLALPLMVAYRSTLTRKKREK
jgi:hypothetical protein